MRKYFSTLGKLKSRLHPLLTRYKRLVWLGWILLHCFPSFAFQPLEDKITVIDGRELLTTITTLPKQISEASGLEFINNNIWTHNDGGIPVLYCLDTAGSLKKTIHINHPNSGWEDLTVDDRGNLYIGAFGNNNNDKRLLKIYKLGDPDRFTERVCTGEIIQYSYEDQVDFPPPPAKRNYDADAFISLGDSLYIFTKNRTSPFTGYTKIYRLPASPGNYKAVLADSIFLGKTSMIENMVTSADVSPDGKTLALLSHQCLWIITGFNGSKFSDGKIFRINLHHLSHKAGLCFTNDKKLLIVDELEFNIIGGKLYSFDLNSPKLQ